MSIKTSTSATSRNRKADELEREGSSQILASEIELGFASWKKAANLRSGKRTVEAKEELLPVTRQYMKPLWTDENDLTRLEKELDTEEGMLNVVYQALLTRLPEDSADHNASDCRYILVHGDRLQKNVGNTYAKFVLLLFEWDALYATTYDPMEFDICRDSDCKKGNFFTLSSYDPWQCYRCRGWTLLEVFSQMVSCWNDNAERSLEERQEFGEIFQQILHLMLGRLQVTVAEHVRSKDAGIDLELAAHDFSVLMWLTELLDEERIAQMRHLLKEMIAADCCVTDCFDRKVNMFLFTCGLTYFITKKLEENILTTSSRRYAEQHRKLIRLFVESGADIDGVDNYGDACLHAFLRTYSDIADVDWETVKFLTERSSLFWDKTTPIGWRSRMIMKKLVNGSLSLCSLSAKVILLNNMRYFLEAVPLQVIKKLRYK